MMLCYCIYVHTAMWHVAHNSNNILIFMRYFGACMSVFIAHNKTQNYVTICNFFLFLFLDFLGVGGCCWEHVGNLLLGACGLVDRALDSRSEGLGFNSQCWPCVEVLDKLRIPLRLGPPSRNGYLMQRFKIGSIVAGCIGAHLVRG